jgi:histidine kinase/DNA gyrase B/HSP90-like ATPase
MPSSAPAPPLRTVNIRPGISVLSILRHLNYRPWFALAEFVDNAVQSYLANRAGLEALHGASFKLTVEIQIDSTPPPRITIRDNAAGIARGDLPRAFRPAAIPPDRSGLSEFGMGMKSAACWFAPRWSVRTKAIGETVERTVRFDIERIVHDQLEELEISELVAEPNAHFTEVVLDDMHHVPIRKTIAKIKEHLTDIYRVYLREDLLELRLGEDSLTYVEPPTLNSPCEWESGGPPHTWRKEINFDLGGGLSVAGFAGLMNPMNTSRTGFALFRRGRLIQGSGDEGYRPALIFGQSGNFRWRRLFGELHLEGFEVSHTKDGFQWDENEQPFLELLREHLNSDELPLLRQADQYRKGLPRNEVAEAAQSAVARTVEAMRATLPEVLPRVAAKPPVETQTIPLDSEPTFVSRELRIDFRGHVWLIRVELTSDEARGEWLSMSDQPAQGADPQIIEIRVSMAHPFMVSFAQTEPDDIEALVRVAAALALAEKLARNAGVRMAKTIRRNMNDILREALARP